MATKKNNTPERRVPTTSSSKSGFKPDEKRPVEFWCVRCAKYFTKQQGNFPTSKSEIYLANNGYLPVCKSCLSELYLYYCEKTNSELEACRRVCMKFDIYYNKALMENVLATTNKEVAMTTYIGKVATTARRMRSYDDTIDEEIINSTDTDLQEDIESKQAKIIEEGRKTWGLDLSADDFIFLDKEYEDWDNRCGIDGKTRESLVREICVIKLMQNKALIANDLETYNKLSSTFQKTLTTAELTPKQVSEMEKATEKPLGVMIEMFENERPIPKPNPEWEDVDGIMKLIMVFFIGHLCAMLGLKNKYAKMYREEMDRLSVNVPEEIQDGDSEDIFDYLLENGFSSSSKDDDYSDGDDGGE